MDMKQNGEQGKPLCPCKYFMQSIANRYEIIYTLRVYMVTVQVLWVFACGCFSARNRIRDHPHVKM